VAAAARGKAARRRGAEQYASVLATPGSRGATGVAGRRRARVEARAWGGGGNGGGAARGGALGSEEMRL
jgi:hypothetical protein